jgi:purine-binding chemotaxis protein CheW
MIATEQALIFRLGEITYAIDSDIIGQILHAPEITKVPLTADTLRGICPIEGLITSIYDGHRLILNKGEVDITNYKSRMITIRKDDLFIGLLVDEVITNIIIDQDKVELNEDAKRDFIEAFIKQDDGIIQLISIIPLLLTVSAPIFKKATITDNLNGQEEGVTTKNSGHKQILTFGMDDEKYAISTELIREILFPADDITQIVDSTPEIIGMITLRNKVLVALDLRTLFGMKHSENEKSRYIIVEREGTTIALFVDHIDNIIDVEIEKIDTIPDKFKNENINGVIEIDNELTSIISDKFIRSLIANAKTTIKEPNIKDHVKQEEMIKDEIVIFAIGKEQYAFNIEDVNEIIKLGDITTLPESPSFIKGIINLRGEIIPIVSLHQRLGFDEEILESSKIFVCDVQNQKIGFIIDSVTDVVQIVEHNIANKSHKNSLFAQVIVLDNSNDIILKIDTKHIFNSKEFESVIKQINTERTDD